MSTYGIDLGTTYSCIATLDANGNPVVIRNDADDSQTLASAVYFESADNVIIGKAAKEYVETDGDRVVQFVKREIGKNDARKYEFDGKPYTPVTISALILGRLKKMVEDSAMNEPVDHVVITVPAYFGLEERNATKEAGEHAGLDVLTLINEPTAAALNYCAQRFQEGQEILVYDLGGGTFDVTVVKMSEDSEHKILVKVLNSDGDDRLGGKDWDDRLFSYVMQKCCDEQGLSESEIEAETRQEIRSKVEEIKKKLSTSESGKERINVNGSKTTVEITRAEFEEMTADLVGKTMSYVEKVLNDKGIKDDDINLVLLVGGSTKMPMIQKAVEDRFPGKVQSGDPDLAVAKGAALFANMIVEEQNESEESGPAAEGSSADGRNRSSGLRMTKIEIEDQTPISFGVGVFGEGIDDPAKEEYILDNIIMMQTTMPATGEREYYTREDRQEGVNIAVFENRSLKDRLRPCVDDQGNEQETDPVDKVKKLGALWLKLPDGTPKNAPIQVSFLIDAAGVHVTAKNPQTGEKVDALFEFKSNASEAEKSAIKSLKISAE